jgi:polysaccharide export outer membrane protein
MTHLFTRHCLVAASVVAATLVASPARAQLQGKGALAPSTGSPSGSTSGSSAGGPAAVGADRPAQTQPQPERPRAAVGDDYILQPGDKLRVEVYKDAQLSQSVQVRPDGKITLPLVGDLPAMGMKPLDLRERIAAALRDYVNNPVVTVIVVEGTVPTAYVVGEVNHPGVVTLTAPMTVLQALAVAGGLKDFADAKNIRILRKSTTGQQTIPFNYKDAIKGDGSSAMVLQPGDTVVVPD